MKFNIYLDMDMVIVNWYKAYFKLFNREDLIDNNPLGIACDEKVTGIKKDYKIKKINDTPGFWENMEKFDWTDHLVNFVESIDPNYLILTNPGKFILAPNEKVNWLHKNIDPEFFRYAITAYKDRLAKKDCILIDDHPGNVDSFIKAGGNAILFPSRENANYIYLDDPVDYVMKQYKDIYNFHNE